MQAFWALQQHKTEPAAERSQLSAVQGADCALFGGGEYVKGAGCNLDPSAHAQALARAALPTQAFWRCSSTSTT